jgi:hypothetical protein
MNCEDIIKLMREACDKDRVDAFQNDFWCVTQEELDRFAALVAAKEREECAKVCLEEAPSLDGQLCADAIRERGKA